MRGNTFPSPYPLPEGRGEKCLRVTMQSREKKVHANVREDDAQKPHERDPGEFLLTPPFQKAQVEIKGVDHPRHKGPSLFRVPTPIRAPRLIRPHGAGSNAQGQQRKSEQDRFVDHLVQLLAREMLLLEWQEIRQTCNKGNREGGIAEKASRDMQDQPIALKRGHKGLYRRVMGKIALKKPNHKGHKGFNKEH